MLFVGLHDQSGICVLLLLLLLLLAHSTAAHLTAKTKTEYTVSEVDFSGLLGEKQNSKTLKCWHESPE